MSNFKIYVTREIPQKGIDMLKEIGDVKVWQDILPPSREVILKEVEDIDGLLPLLTDKIDEEIFSKAKNLKIVSNYAVGYDNIDISAATKRKIMVTNTPGVLTETTADLAFSILMAAARRIVEGDKFLRNGEWQCWSPKLLLGQDIYGATLGIIGFGRIGQAMARRASGFDMRILVYNRKEDKELGKNLGVTFVSFDTLIKESDFISLHIPLTKETHHILGKKEFAKMKKSAIVINSSRGSVIDQKALFEALKNDVIAGAGLDVFEKEPIDMDDPLLTLDNIVMVPHLGSGSTATRTKMAEMAAGNLIAGLKGEAPPNLVNPEVLQ